MKKKLMSLLAAVLLAAVALTLSSCADPEVPADMTGISGENDAFFLYVPKTWVTERSTGYVTAYYSLDDPANISLMPYSPTVEMNVPEYWAASLEEFKLTYPTVEVVSESLESTLGGRPAGRYVFTAQVGEKAYKFMQLITASDGIFFVFTYTSAAETFDSHLEDVEKIIEHVVFK